MKKTLVAAVLVVLPVLAAAEKPHAGAEVAVRTARITTIDHDARLVTLAQQDETETIQCGPEVDRFDELKVGDTVTMRYYHSVVYMVRKAGQPSTLPADERRAVAVPRPRPEAGGHLVAAADRDRDGRGDRQQGPRGHRRDGRRPPSELQGPSAERHRRPQGRRQVGDRLHRSARDQRRVTTWTGGSSRRGREQWPRDRFPWGM